MALSLGCVCQPCSSSGYTNASYARGYTQRSTIMRPRPKGQSALSSGHVGSSSHPIPAGGKRMTCDGAVEDRAVPSAVFWSSMLTRQPPPSLPVRVKPPTTDIAAQRPSLELDTSPADAHACADEHSAKGEEKRVAATEGILEQLKMEPVERVAPDSPTDSAADSPTRSLSESTSNGEMALADGVIREVISTLGKLEDEAQTEAVREGIAVQRRQLKGLLKEQLKENMRRRWRKVVTGDEAKRVRDHIREPIVARSIDKFSFTFGVLNLAISEFILVKHPSHFWIWYMMVIPALVCFRIWHYTSNKWQYFLMDFCYYTQILCIAQLFFFQRNCSLFKANFMLSNGPLAWAVPVWRNSLVFHDVEKVTSLFIHVFPGLLLYTLKWYPSVTTTGSWSAHESCGPITWKDVVLASLLYIAWQMMYYLKVEVLEKAKLDADPDLQTSLRWLAKDRKNMLHKLVLRITRSVGILAPDEVFDHRAVKTKIIFILTQFVYTMVTTTPAILIYQNFYLHVAYGIFLFVVAVFNGAAYYIEVFSVRYVNKYPRERPAGLGVGFVAQRTAQAVAATAAGLPPELKRSMSDGHCTVLQAEHTTAVALDDKKNT